MCPILFRNFNFTITFNRYYKLLIKQSFQFFHHHSHLSHYYFYISANLFAHPEKNKLSHPFKYLTTYILWILYSYFSSFKNKLKIFKSVPKNREIWRKN